MSSVLFYGKCGTWSTRTDDAGTESSCSGGQGHSGLHRSRENLEPPRLRYCTRGACVLLTGLGRNRSEGGSETPLFNQKVFGSLNVDFPEGKGHSFGVLTLIRRGGSCTLRYLNFLTPCQITCFHTPETLRVKLTQPRKKQQQEITKALISGLEQTGDPYTFWVHQISIER